MDEVLFELRCQDVDNGLVFPLKHVDHGHTVQIALIVRLSARSGIEASALQDNPWLGIHAYPLYNPCLELSSIWI
jgi:hypothetical protein